MKLNKSPGIDGLTVAEFSSNVELKCTKGVLDQHSIEILVYCYLISMGHLF
jgi:hypothetical protein